MMPGDLSTECRYQALMLTENIFEFSSGYFGLLAWYMR